MREGGLHPVAWLGWVSLVMVLALVTTNPYYLVTLLLAVLLVAALAPWSATGLATFRVMLLAGAGIGVFSIAIATVNGAGGEHVLFTVPGPSFPDWFGGLRLGGPFTAEALVAASIRAAAILAVFLSFAIFNGAVSPVRLLRLAPASLFHASLVITVGLTLLPSIVQDTRRIREMQMLRGSRTGLRQLPGLVVPAVLGGLDRSLRLAEAMEARGYASAPPAPVLARVAGLAATPCFLVAAWSWLYADRYSFVAPMAGVAGIALLVAWFAGSSRQRATTRLHEDPVPRLQAIAAAASTALAISLPVLRDRGPLNLAYNPFAGLPAPPFEAIAAIVVLLAAWPVAFLVLGGAGVPSTEEPAPGLQRGGAVPR